MHIWLLFHEAGSGIDIRVIIIVYGFGSASICDALGLLFTWHMYVRVGECEVIIGGIKSMANAQV